MIYDAIEGPVRVASYPFAESGLRRLFQTGYRVALLAEQPGLAILGLIGMLADTFMERKIGGLTCVLRRVESSGDNLWGLIFICHSCRCYVDLVFWDV